MALKNKDEYIEFAELMGAKYGLPSNFMTTMMRIESNFNPDAVSSTGAKGLYQFTKGTGKQYGLVGKGFDDRFDPEKNIEAAARLAKDNYNTLKKLGIDNPQAHDLYGAHQQGAKGWANLTNQASDPSSSLSAGQLKNIGVNISSKDKALFDSLTTDSEKASFFKNLWVDKFNKFGAEFGVASEGQKKNTPAGTIRRGGSAEIVGAFQSKPQQAAELPKVFDLQGAIASGHDEAKALAYVKDKYGFDAPGAKASGHSVTSIHNYINTQDYLDKLKDTPKQEPEKPLQTPADREQMAMRMAREGGGFPTGPSTSIDKMLAEERGARERAQRREDLTTVGVETAKGLKSKGETIFSKLRVGGMESLYKRLNTEDKAFIDQLSAEKNVETAEVDGGVQETVSSLTDEQISERVNAYIESLNIQDPAIKNEKTSLLNTLARKEDAKEVLKLDTREAVESGIKVSEAIADLADTPDKQGEIIFAEAWRDFKKDLATGQINAGLTRLSAEASAVGDQESALKILNYRDMVSSRLNTLDEDSGTFKRTASAVTQMMPFMIMSMAPRVAGGALTASTGVGAFKTAGDIFALYSGIMQGSGEVQDQIRNEVIQAEGYTEESKKKILKKFDEEWDKRIAVGTAYALLEYAQGGRAIDRLTGRVGTFLKFSKDAAVDIGQEMLQKGVVNLGAGISKEDVDLDDVANSLFSAYEGAKQEGKDVFLPMLANAIIFRGAGKFGSFLKQSSEDLANIQIDQGQVKGEIEAPTQVSEQEQVLDQLLEEDTDAIEEEFESLTDEELELLKGKEPKSKKDIDISALPQSREEDALLSNAEKFVDSNIGDDRTLAQFREMIRHRTDMENLAGRYVSMAEAENDWVFSGEGRKKSLAQLFGEKREPQVTDVERSEGNVLNVPMSSESINLESTNVPTTIRELAKVFGVEQSITMLDANDSNAISSWYDTQSIEAHEDMVNVPSNEGRSVIEGSNALIVLGRTGDSRKDLVNALHEFGHIVKDSKFAGASRDLRGAIVREWVKIKKVSIAEQDLKVFLEAMAGGESSFSPRSGISTSQLTKEQLQYLSSFDEYMAERISNYSKVSDRPSDAIGRFFYDIAQTFKKIFKRLKSEKAIPESTTLNQWLDKMVEASGYVSKAKPSRVKSLKQLPTRTMTQYQAGFRAGKKLDWLAGAKSIGEMLDTMSANKVRDFKDKRQRISDEALELLNELNEDEYYATMSTREQVEKAIKDGTYFELVESNKGRAASGERLTYEEAIEFASEYSSTKTDVKDAKGISKDVAEKVKKAVRKAKADKKAKVPKIKPKEKAIDAEELERQIETATIREIKDIDRARKVFEFNFIRKLKPGVLRTSLFRTVGNIKKVGDKNWNRAVQVVENLKMRDDKHNTLNSIKATIKKLKNRTMSEGIKAEFDKINSKYDTKKLVNSNHRDRLEALNAELIKDAEIEVPTTYKSKLDEEVERLNKEFLGDLSLEEMQEVEEQLATLLEEQIRIDRERAQAKAAEKKSRDAELSETVDDYGERKGVDPVDFSSNPFERAKNKFVKRLKGARTFLTEQWTHLPTFTYIMDRGKGAITKYITKPLKEAADTETYHSNVTKGSFVDALKGTRINFAEWSDKQHYGVLNGVVNLVKSAPRDEFKVSNGRFTMTKAEQVGFVATMLDRDGLRHMLEGGFVFKTNDGTSKTFKPSADDLKAIYEQVDADVKKTVEAIQKHLKGDPKRILDNFTRRYQDRVITTTGYYYPLKVDNNQIFMTESEKDNMNLDHANISDVLKNFNSLYPKSGSVKRRKIGANQPLVIEDFFRTMTRYNKDIATYTAYQDKVNELNSTFKSLQGMMEKEGLKQQYKVLWETYNSILDRSSANKTSSSGSALWYAIRSLAVKGTLSLNPRVMAMQTVSGIHYMVTVEDPARKAKLYASIPKVAAKMSKEGVPFKETALEKEMKEISHLAKVRFEDDMGGDFTDDRVTSNSRNVINKVSKGDRVRRIADFMKTDQAIKSIGYGDKIGIKTLYLLAKEDVLLDGYKEGTSEFKKELRGRFESAVHRTQPTSYAIDRSKLASNILFKDVTMYTNQRSKIFNEIIRATIDLSDGVKSKDQKKIESSLANIVHLTVVNNTLLSILGKGVVGTAMWSLLSGEEPEEELMKKLLKEQFALSAGNIMVVGDVFNAIATDDKIFNSASFTGATKDEIVRFIRAAKKYSKDPTSKNRETLMKAGGRFSKKIGIPIDAVSKWQEYFNLKEDE